MGSLWCWDGVEGTPHAGVPHSAPFWLPLYMLGAHHLLISYLLGLQWTPPALFRLRTDENVRLTLTRRRNDSILTKSQSWIRFIFLMYFCDGYIKLVLIRQENDCVRGLFAKARVPSSLSDSSPRICHAFVSVPPLRPLLPYAFFLPLSRWSRRPRMLSSVKTLNYNAVHQQPFG